MSKERPREWELWTTICGERKVGGEDIPNDDGDPLRVIEYSAYQDLQKKAEALVLALESQLRFAAGYISTTEGFTEKHPEEVLQWLGIEWDKIQQYDDKVYNQRCNSDVE